MGCGGSKLDELEAVALCRNRCNLLANAIRHRYALADAHAAYADSLRSVGAALHRLLEGGSLGSSFPVLPLPAQRKGDPLPSPSPSPPPPPRQAVAAPAAATAATTMAAHSRSRSHSGSHIHFHSSDNSDSDGDSPFHSDGDSPIDFHPDHHETLGGGPTYVNLHYAKNKPPPPSVSFEQRVGSSEQVHYGSFPEPSASSSSYPYAYPYPTQNPNSSQYPFPYAYQPNHYGYGGGLGGFFGSSSPPPAIPQPPPSFAGANTKASTSRAAPPPPSPPRTSTWDFLNPFESFENYYPTYASSRSSKEVREDEGIPDLEEDDQEVIKEAYGDPKFVASTSASSMPEYSSKAAAVEEENVVGSPEEVSQYHPRAKQDEEDVVEKNVVGSEVQKLQEERRNAVAPRRYHDVSEVVGEIRVQFEMAAESTKQLSGMLEVGKHPYNRKSSAYAVSSRMLCVIPVSTSKDEELVYEEDKVMRTGNLSSTLQKLYIWEQKLLDEVRVEEKLRLFHDKNSRKLQHLDDSGAESYKIDATQKLIRKLSTKIRITIHIVNSISTKINMVRDEELWPQIDELIEGLERMWKVMWECHQIQCRAISEANYIDSIASGGKLSDAHVNAMMLLEVEMLRWIGNFSAWINSQKNFVKALNGWLVLCLNYEPEETADGIPPYSPGRIGAPPVFVIFNSWSQALDRVSEKEVLDSIHSFAASMKHLLQQNDTEIRQKLIANREMERLQKMKEREAQLIKKETEALNKKLVVGSGKDNPPLREPAEPSGLHSALKHVFEAIESYTTNSMKAYEDLHARAKEEKAAMEAKGVQNIREEHARSPWAVAPDQFWPPWTELRDDSAAEAAQSSTFGAGNNNFPVATSRRKGVTAQKGGDLKLQNFNL